MHTRTNELAAKWRELAAAVRSAAAPHHAELLEKCAAELEASLYADALEALTLEQAVGESGYSYSSLQKKVASGELENVGEAGRPRVRRGDLPRKGKRPEGLADGLLLRRAGII